MIEIKNARSRNKMKKNLGIMGMNLIEASGPGMPMNESQRNGRHKRIQTVLLLTFLVCSNLCYATRSLGSPAATNALASKESYLERVAQQINEALRKQKISEKFSRCSVNLLLDSKGTVSQFKLRASTGKAEIDQAVINAICLAGPYPKPPSSSGKLYVRANVFSEQTIVAESAQFVGESPDSVSSTSRDRGQEKQVGDLPHKKRPFLAPTTATTSQANLTRIPAKEQSPSLFSDPSWTTRSIWDNDAEKNAHSNFLGNRSGEKERQNGNSGAAVSEPLILSNTKILSMSSNKGKEKQAVDFGPYMQDLQRRIKRHWFPPRGLESKRVAVAFKIHEDGALEALRIFESSNLPQADKAAMDSINNATPFPVLPKGAPHVVDIEFAFDYNVFSGGRSSLKGGASE